MSIVNVFNSEKELFNDGKVEWRSDDFPYETASSITIEKNDETIDICFHKSHDEVFFNTYGVRFRNSGSRYEPYNATFMNMYNNLKQFENSFHQIHFEEYKYLKKLTKTLK